eukprot:14119706-Ditylum_brightwellii.AAC.1
MASFLGSQLVTLVFRALDRGTADDTLETLVAQGEGQVLKVAHCMHVAVVLFNHLINLVLDKCIEILDPFVT